jgi:hypothetical protein
MGKEMKERKNDGIGMGKARWKVGGKNMGFTIIYKL